MNKIVHGHVLDVLRDMENEQVDCVITSPPYWGLRSYGTKPQIWDGEDCEHEWENMLRNSVAGGKDHGGYGSWTNDWKKNDLIREDRTVSQGNFCLKCNAWRGELGLEPDFNLYIKHLIQVFNKVKRVLKKTGTCWVNLGDSYVGGKGASSGVFDKERDTNRRTLQKSYQHTGGSGITRPSDNRNLGIQPKSLCQIPQRFSIAMTDNDWILRNTIIWHKTNCMPQSANDRFTVDFEYIYFFVKSQKYYFEQQFEEMDFKEMNYRSDIRRNKNYNHSFESPTQKWADDSEIKVNLQGRNKRSVWKFATQPSSEEHFASYPNELVRIPIEAGCPKDGTVLDPFSGTGTTLYVAKELRRNYIGIDLKSDYNKLADKRLRQEMLL